MTDLETIQAENAELKRKLKNACDLAEALDERFKRVWREAVASSPAIDAITAGMSISYFITRRLR